MTLRTPRPFAGRRSAARVRTTGVALAVAFAALSASTYAGVAHAAGDSPFADAGAGPTIDQLPAIVLDAHRAGGLEARENSLSGIRRALGSGVVDVVDLDVRRLADGALGVMHDATVDRVTTSTGPTASYTREKWQSLTLDIGSWLVPRPPSEAPPTLSGVLERFGDRSVFTVEVKEGLVDEVARLLHQSGLRAHLWRTAAQMRTDDPRSFVGFTDLLDLDLRARPEDFRRAVHSGVPLVWAHTITTRAERDRALRLGATGIVADDPRYVAGTTDTYPTSPTVLEVRRAPEPVQVSDRTSARIAASSQSGPALREAVVTVASPEVSGRTVARSDEGVSTLQLSAAGAERGRTDVGFRVAAGSAGERRWPAGQISVPVHVTGEDLQLVPSVRVGRRGLHVEVKLRDSAAARYAGPRPERGADPTPARLRKAELRLRVIRRGEVVHRERLTGEDTGAPGDGVGRVTFSRWEAPHHGWCTVRVVQRGPEYRHVEAEQRVRLG